MKVLARCFLTFCQTKMKSIELLLAQQLLILSKKIQTHGLFCQGKSNSRFLRCVWVPAIPQLGQCGSGALAFSERCVVCTLLAQLPLRYRCDWLGALDCTDLLLYFYQCFPDVNKTIQIEHNRAAHGAAQLVFFRLNDKTAHLLTVLGRIYRVALQKHIF